MSDNRTEDETAIKAALVDSYKAWEAGDADGMVANYTADAICHHDRLAPQQP